MPTSQMKNDENNDEQDLPSDIPYVWCSISRSVLENPRLLYSLCRLHNKNNNKYILSEVYENNINTTTNATTTNATTTNATTTNATTTNVTTFKTSSSLFESDPEYVFAADINQKPLEQDDMIQVEHFNYAVLLHHLSERYINKKRFTKFGPLWICVNPYTNTNTNTNTDTDTDTDTYTYIKKNRNKKKKKIGNTNTNTNTSAYMKYNINSNSNTNRGIDINVNLEANEDTDKEINDDMSNDTYTNTIEMEYYQRINKKKDHLFMRNIHIYDAVKTAIDNLSILKKSQSIIITGAPGSGKSELMKQIIDFLLCNKSRNICYQKNKNFSNLTAIGQVLKLSDIILEAFGNFEHKKNNISGFTKLATLYLNTETVTHFHLKQYLLNTEQLTNKELGTQNFSIFYYIVNGASEHLKNKYFFRNKEYYRLLKNGTIDNTDNTDNVDNSKNTFTEKLDELIKALQKFVANEKEIDYIFSVLSGILLLGNIEVFKKKASRVLNEGFICEFGQQDNDSNIKKEEEEENEMIKKFYEDSYIDDKDKNVVLLFLAGKLLGINPEVLLNYFTYNELKKPEIKFANTYTQQNIISRIQKFIETMYEELFQWLLMKINIKGNISNVKKTHPCLNILDISLFENLKENGLHQLLHNTTFEGTLKICNDFFFKKRLSECKGEGIKSDNISFNDNTDRFRLLTGKEDSLFSIIESSTVKNLDKGDLAPTIIKKFHKSPFIKETNSIPDRRKLFLVNHSCGPIVYRTDKFIDINANRLTTEFIDIVRSSENAVVKEFCAFFKYDRSGKLLVTSPKTSLLGGETGGAYYALSTNRFCDPQNLFLITTYRKKLLELIKSLDNSFCHFFFCINPNEKEEPLHFEKRFVLEQLKTFNILYWSKLKNKYYPYSFKFDHFLEIVEFVKAGNFHVLNQQMEETERTPITRNAMSLTEKVELIKNVFEEHAISSVHCCLGRNMVFLDEAAVSRIFHHYFDKWKEKKNYEMADEKKNPILEKEQTNVNLSGSTKKSYASTIPLEVSDLTAHEEYEFVSLKTRCPSDNKENEQRHNNSHTTNSMHTPHNMSMYEPAKHLHIETVEESIPIGNPNGNNQYEVLNLINSVTIYDEKLGQINEALKHFKPINEQLKKDSVFNLGIYNLITPSELFSNDNNSERLKTHRSKTNTRKAKKRKTKKSKNKMTKKGDIKKKRTLVSKIYSRRNMNFCLKRQKDSYEQLGDVKRQQNDQTNKENTKKDNQVCSFQIVNRLKEVIFDNEAIAEGCFCICFNENNNLKRESECVVCDQLVSNNVQKGHKHNTDHNNTDHNNVNHNSTNHNNTHHNSTNHNNTSHNNANHNSTHHDSTHHDSTHHDSTNQNSTHHNKKKNHHHHHHSHHHSHHHNHHHNHNHHQHDKHEIEKKNEVSNKEKYDKEKHLIEIKNLYLYNSENDSVFTNNLKKIKEEFESKYGKKWNIFLCTSKCFFATVAHDTDTICLKIDKDNQNVENEEETDRNKLIDLINDNDIIQEQITEYVYLPEETVNKDLFICNKVEIDQLIQNGYQVLCFRSKETSTSERLEAQKFYESIYYNNQISRNITEVNIHFSYMDEKMKKNFRQHVINEYILHPEMNVQELAQSLLQIAIHFYHEKIGSWSVLIFDTKIFTGIINVVKNRYLRMSIKRNGRTYHAILFESPV